MITIVFLIAIQSASDARELIPKLISSTRLTGEHDIKAVDTLVFCTYKNALDILNVSDPESPVYLCGCYTQDYIYGLDVSGRYVYLANSSCGLKIVDITDPVNPTLAGKYKTSGGAMAVFYSDGYAYVVDGVGLQIIDVSNPASPVLAGSCDTPGSSWHVYVVDDYAYVAAVNSGLQIIDVSDPARPKLLGSCKTSGPALRVYVDRDYAYVAAGKSGLQVIDISNPSKPKLAGGYDTPGQALGIHVSDGFAYVADDTAGIQIIDVSDPQTASLAGSYFTKGIARFVYVEGGYVYLANFSSMLILDIGQTGIDETEILPDRFILYQNYPNPFNATTLIKYGLPHQAYVTINIYDVLGRKVTTLVNMQQPAGNHQAIWRGNEHSSGMYFYKIQAGEYSETRKMILLK